MVNYVHGGHDKRPVMGRKAQVEVRKMRSLRGKVYRGPFAGMVIHAQKYAANNQLFANFQIEVSLK